MSSYCGSETKLRRPTHLELPNAYQCIGLDGHSSWHCVSQIAVWLCLIVCRRDGEHFSWCCMVGCGLALLQWPFLLTLCCRHVWHGTTGWCGCSFTPPSFYLETEQALRLISWISPFARSNAAVLRSLISAQNGLLTRCFFTVLLFSSEDGETLATQEEGQCGLPGGHQDSTHVEGSQPSSCRVFGKWTQGMPGSARAAARIWQCLWFDQAMRVYRSWQLACQSLSDLSRACSASAPGNFP